MTKDERNAAICAYYKAGHKVMACATHFKLGKQRILQILKKGEVYRPLVTGTRTKFLGVSVKDATKAGLSTMAKKRGVSVSKLTSDALDDMVARIEK